MISHLHNTTVSAINKELSHLTAANGSLSSGRVLTLVVLAEKYSREAMRAAIRASHEHPSRIIVHISHDPLDPDQLDAEIHLGGDTGASEMIVLRGWGSASRPTEALISGLLLPDSPIVVWYALGAREPGTALHRSYRAASHYRLCARRRPEGSVA